MFSFKMNPSDSRAFADAQSCRELEDGVSVLRVDPHVAGLYVNVSWGLFWGLVLGGRTYRRRTFVEAQSFCAVAFVLVDSQVARVASSFASHHRNQAHRLPEHAVHNLEAGQRARDRAVRLWCAVLLARQPAQGSRESASHRARGRANGGSAEFRLSHRELQTKVLFVRDCRDVEKGDSCHPDPAWTVLQSDYRRSTTVA